MECLLQAQLYAQQRVFQSLEKAAQLATQLPVPGPTHPCYLYRLVQCKVK